MVNNKTAQGWQEAKKEQGRKLMVPQTEKGGRFLFCTLALSRGTPCQRACVADRRGAEAGASLKCICAGQS